MKDTYFLPEKL